MCFTKILWDSWPWLRHHWRRSHKLHWLLIPVLWWATRILLLSRSLLLLLGCFIASYFHLLLILLLYCYFLLFRWRLRSWLPWNILLLWISLLMICMAKMLGRRRPWHVEILLISLLLLELSCHLLNKGWILKLSNCIWSTHSDKLHE